MFYNYFLIQIYVFYNYNYTRLHRYIKDKKKLKLWQHYYELYCKYLLPNIGKLRKSVIHGDLNDWNIIINSCINDKNDVLLFNNNKKSIDTKYNDYYIDSHNLNNKINLKIDGIIDFGFSHYSCTMFDIAICGAYFMLNKKDPMFAFIEIINGYNSVFKMEPIEIDLVFVAAMTRLITSASMAPYKIAIHPHLKTYYQSSSLPAWTVLDKFQNITPEYVSKLIRQRIQQSQNIVSKI